MAKNLNKACPINEKATATAASSSTSSPSKPHPSQVNLLFDVRFRRRQNVVQGSDQTRSHFEPKRISFSLSERLTCQAPKGLGNTWGI